MELAHTFTVPADPDRTWALLTDLEQVGNCFPGAQVTETDGDTFSGTVKVKLGPIAMQYAGTGQFLERDQAGHRAVIEGKGKDKRGNGTAAATATLQLTPDGSGTRVQVLTDLTVTGKPAQFGRGVMQDVSDKLLGQFVACLERNLGTVPEAGPAPADPAAAGGAGPGPDDLGGVPTREVDPPPMATVHRAGSVGTGPGSADDDAIDLGELVGPVLRERYGIAAAAALAGLVVGIAIGRGSRS